MCFGPSQNVQDFWWCLGSESGFGTGFSGFSPIQNMVEKCVNMITEKVTDWFIGNFQWRTALPLPKVDYTLVMIQITPGSRTLPD